MSLRSVHGILVFFTLFFLACQPGKYLADGEQLYGGAEIKFNKSESNPPGNKTKEALIAKIQQTTNKKFKLRVYQKNKNKEKGFGKWLKKKIGEAPVFYNPELTERSRLLMQQYLRESGYLNAIVFTDTIQKDYFIKVKYRIHDKGRFFINNYIIPPDTTHLLGLINEKVRKPIIKSGDPYTKIAIDAERQRIENLAKNNGFYEFESASTYFLVDTTLNKNKLLDIYLLIRPPADQKNYKPHQLGDVTIYPNYALNEDISNDINTHTIRSGYWSLIQKRKVVNLRTFQEAIAQDSSEVYSQQLERQAINYLLDFGVFKFVNLKYTKRMVGDQAILDRSFYLTPSLNQDFGLSLEATTERTNFLGSSVGVNYTHRNLFNGAEFFKTGLSVGAELQAGGNGPFFNTVEANYEAGLSIPRLLLPFKINSRLRSTIPKTLINLKAVYQQRNSLFSSVSFLTELGYTWKKSTRLQHAFYPLQFTFLNLLETSTEFNEELAQNPRLRASFDDLVILAALYRLNFTNQILGKRNNFYFISTEIETAGNVASAIAQGQDTKKLLNLPISQFTKIQTEGRYTFYQKKSSIATRLALGYALPYGNSEAVPYVRQFFVGGANSNRAFRFRGVGPGTYEPEENNDPENVAFFDRVGDIKIEGNAEYRFPIAGYFKGAFFLDAGNVWLSKKSGEDLPEGVFEFNQFYRQLAVGTGFGIRLDIEYVVIRFDFGFPLRIPSRPSDDRWVIKEIDFLSKDWRKDFLKFNLAIGYPF